MASGGVGPVTDWHTEVEKAIKDFVAVANLAHSPLRQNELVVEFLEAPHTPPKSLPKGKMAVYGFWYGGKWLKIGMAGLNSQARYTSQHYNPGSAPSTLASSLAQDPRMSRTQGFDRSVPGNWIKQQTNRVNILMSSRHGKVLLALLEAFLHVRLKPRYEK